MSISEKIKSIDFLKNREVIDQTDHSGIGMIGFKHNEKDLYSSIIFSEKSTNGVVPAIVMISSLGALLKLDTGENQITISISSAGEREGFFETFPSSLDEGEFFQNSLIHDFRHITYEHIVALRDVLKLNDVQD
jgi:hypothetical protein